MVSIYCLASLTQCGLMSMQADFASGNRCKDVGCETMTGSVYVFISALQSRTRMAGYTSTVTAFLRFFPTTATVYWAAFK